MITDLRHLDMDWDSATTEDIIDCTPDTKTQMISLKRKAREISEQNPLTSTSVFLKWRLAVVHSALRVREVEKQALSEAKTFFTEAGRPKKEFLAAVEEDEKALLAEKVVLLTQRRILEQDLNDVISSKVVLEEAHMTELKAEMARPKSPEVRHESFPGHCQQVSRHSVRHRRFAQMVQCPWILAELCLSEKRPHCSSFMEHEGNGP